MKHWLPLVLFGLLLPCGRAEARTMLVFKDGNPVWADSVSKKEDTVTYKVAGSDSIRTVSAGELTGLIPEVERGKKYDAAHIESVIKRIKTVQSRHHALRRPLTSILQEWEALKQPAVDLNPEIDACIQDFNSSAKDMETYRRTAMEMGMIKYKDVRSDHTARLDKALSDMRASFVKVNTERLTNQTNQTPTIEEFIKAMELGGFLLDMAEGAEKTVLTEAVTLLRRNTLDANLKRAEASFSSGGKSLRAFRDAMELLRRTRHQVANDDTLRATVDALSSQIVTQALEASVIEAQAGFAGADGRISAYLDGMQLFFKVRDAALQAGLPPEAITVAQDGLMAAAAQCYPDFVFSYRGFPLIAEEAVTVRETDYASTFDPPDLTVEEECLIIPLKDPGVVPTAGNFEVPIQFIFNQRQPTDRNYAIMLRVQGAGGTSAQDIKILPALTLTDGRLRLRLAGNLTFLYAGFEPLRDEQGTAFLNVYLAYQQISDAHGQRWVPISRTCRWKLQ